MLSCLFAIVLFISNTSVCQDPEQNHASYQQNQETLIEDLPTVELNDITTEDIFGTQMNAILLDFPNQFINLKSIPWSDSDSFPIPRYHSRIQLTSAVYNYIQEEQPSKHATYQAYLPGTTVPEFAVQAYSQLKANFENYSYYMGSFDHREEIVDGSKRSQIYYLKIAEGKSNLAFEKMLVEIGVEQGIIVGEPGVETIVWVAFVKVYEKG